jgi:hypothetical protein
MINGYPRTDVEYKPVHEDVASTGECTPSVFKAMVLGLECGPAEIDNLGVVPVADKDPIPVGSNNIFQDNSLNEPYGLVDSTDLSDSSSAEYIPDDMGYVLGKFLDNCKPGE